MYKRLSAVMFPILSIALIGAVVWGYQENQEKNAVLIKAENQYQRAFHDLSYHMEQLHTELGKSLAVNSASQGYQRKSLVNVWRLTSEAQNEVNQLPLTLLPFNKTEELLANIANFSYRAAVRDMTKQPLSKQETNTLASLYKRSKEISHELHAVQNKVIDKQLRWMDVESALATENKQMDNTIIDGFKTVDKKVSEYEEIDFGPSTMTLYQSRKMSALSGPDMTAKQIKQKAAKFLRVPSTTAMKVIENGTGTEYGSFSVEVNRAGNRVVSMDFTKKGGKLIWFMDSRPVSPTRQLSVDRASSAARDFLEKHNYKNMTPVGYDDYGNVASITFAAMQDGVIVYPEKLTVKVALDKGDVIGLQASDYIFEQKKRIINKPKVSEAQARKSLIQGFQVSEHALALIDNDSREEVLCHQYTGKINGSHYRIYINAENGTEEKVEEIRFEETEV